MRFYLKQRGEAWYICWTEPDGTPRRASTGTRDRDEADRALARHVLTHDRPRDQRLTDTTLEAALLRYWLQYGRSHLFDKGAVRRVIGLVARHAPMLPLSDFTIGRQEQFRAEAMPHLAAGSQRRYFGVIEAAVNWAFQRGEIERTLPFLRLHAEDGDGAHPFTLDEMRRLLEAAETDRERLFVLLSIATGPRPGALLQLTWDRVLTESAIDFHKPGRRRTKKRRAKVPQAPILARYLAERRSLGAVIAYRGRPMAGHKSLFARVARAAGVQGSAYGMRKGLSTWLRQQNVPEWEVSAVLGHRNANASSTTERYAHHRPDFMAATKAAVDALLTEIAPSWLASYLPGRTEPVAVALPKYLIANGDSGARYRDRTCDPFHVKDGEPASFQGLEAANDD